LDSKNLKLDSKREETEFITTYTFKCDSDKELPSYKSGKYIAIKLYNVNDYSECTIRTYSLSDSYNPHYYRITVKSELSQSSNIPDGAFSVHMKKNLNVGDIVELSCPFGLFEVKEIDSPIVFLAGGIGITPVFSMLNEITKAGTNQPIYLVYALKNGAYHVFDEDFKTMMKKYSNVKYHVIYSQAKENESQGVHYNSVGHINVDLVKSFVASEHILSSTYYICGDPIVKTCLSITKDLNIPSSRIHFEFFGPLGSGL